MLVDNARRKSVNILRICKSTFRRPYTYVHHKFVGSHRFVSHVSVTCEIWLQIKPDLDVSSTLDAGKSESMLEILRDFL